MRRFLLVVLPVLFLFGCKSSVGVEPALKLRNELLQSNGCSFDAIVTADYGENIYTFKMDCQIDKERNLTFTVLAPDTISGITGKINNEEGKLTYNEKILAFPLLTEGQLTPVSAPWIFAHTLCNGYIGAGGRNGNFYKVQIDDIYKEVPLRVDIWLNKNNEPVHCDFLWKERRILTLEIENFCIL